MSSKASDVIVEGTGLLPLSRGYTGLILLLGVVIAGLYAAHPLFEPRLPHGTDTLTQLYTLVPLNHQFREGILFSRWAPYRASGFGTPLFNYGAPLAYYGAQMFNILVGDAVMATRMAFGFGLVGAGVGMYLWVREAFGPKAGLISTAAYVCGSYMLFTTYFRGGLNEQYGLLFMPWSMWALRRLATTGHARYLSLTGLAYAGVILSHNLTTLLFSPVLLAYAVLLTIVPLQPPGSHPSSSGALGRSRVAAGPLLGVGLGLGLSCFFWLPMVVERNAVLTELLYSGVEFDYHHNFIQIGDLFSPIAVAASRPTLSLTVVCLALLGMVWAWCSTAEIRWEVALVGLVAAGYTFMVLPFSVGVWEVLRPVLQYLQFPHRFLGVASLCLSFLVGGGFCALELGLASIRPVRDSQALACRGRAIVLAVVIGLLLVPTRVLGDVRYYPPLPEMDIGFVMSKEREAGNIDTTYVISFIPRAAQEMPPFELLARDGPERLDAEGLPSGTDILSQDYAPLRYELVFSSAQPFTATFNTFYFPGWMAEVDGKPVELVPEVPYGRISVPVPEGQHRLEVWFGTTPPRVLANGVSLLSLLALGILGYARPLKS